MEKIRISAVRYANTYPFIFGLIESGFDKKAIIETDHPSDCASKVIEGRADLGLVPVTAIPLIKESYLISNFCIAADGKVRSIQIMSNSPLESVEKVYLDYRSGTSVNLIKVLAKKYWKRNFIWAETSDVFDFTTIGLNEAIVLIGDQCFEYEKRYFNRIDLAEEWKKHTGLPFVFACWIANKPLPSDFIEDFNNALSFGVNNIEKVVTRFAETGSITGQELREYLTNNIDFFLDAKKEKAMNFFLELLKEL